MAKIKKCLSVGVVGFSNQDFDKDKAFQILAQTFELIESLASPIIPIEVVSGLTSMGIPLMAYEFAYNHGWKTVGIACSKAYEYSIFDCDEKIIVGKKWGAESRRFLKRCDIIIRVGGGKQSFKEIKKAKELGIRVLEFDLPAAKPKPKKGKK